ncbi:MAG: metal ABC transporter permease [Candidatus Gracilibacteria bacterium]|nr:metal ABC transporter permease [Candidatus Gracilibacteria bacterium]
MLDILKYDFFQNALIGGILISLLSGIFGVLVVMRKEANITHSISNFLFLGVTVSLFFSGNYYFYAFLFGIIGSLIIFFLEKTNLITRESTKEIISQIGMSLAIFMIGFLQNLSLDINNFLFGSILFVNNYDLIIISGLVLVGYTLLYFYGRKFLAIIINEDISRSMGIRVNYYNLFFLVFLSVFLGVSIKIFGILLIGAFLVIPSNIGKIFGNSIKKVFFISVCSSLFSVVFGLFSSYYLGTSTSSTIVLTLLFIFFVGVAFKKIFK